MFRVLTFIASFIIIVNTAYAASFYDEMHDAIVKNDIRTVESLLKKTNADPNERRDTRAAPTFLTQAARLGREEIVKLLIAAGADVNAGDGDALTPLMWAAWEGHARIVEILLKAGANIQDQDKWGETALQHAIQSKHEDVILILKKAGAKE